VRAERQLQAEIEAELERLGYYWHHCADPRRCRGPGGFPDLIYAGGLRFGAIEVKGPRGIRSPAQRRWASQLAMSDVDCELVSKWGWPDFRDKKLRG
jgi:hypothetical protein